MFSFKAESSQLLCLLLILLLFLLQLFHVDSVDRLGIGLGEAFWNIVLLIEVLKEVN
jgi:hypothetical protein